MKQNKPGFYRNFPPRPKLFLPLFLLIFSLVFLSFSPAFAEETPSEKSPTSTSEKATPSLSSDQLAHISTSCSTYRTQLKTLQRSDSRARTYFGAIYETVSSKYLTPLNLRLVKNNLSSPDLISAQTSLATLRTDFSSHFITYSKSLEDLINLDCRLEPAAFYAQLVLVRKNRALVETDMKKINSLLSALPAQTESLITTLEKTKDVSDQKTQ